MRPEKKSIIKEYSDALNETQYVLLADYRGLTVAQFTELRERLREVGASTQVVKNCLFSLALTQRGWGNLASFMDGPTAMIRGAGEITSLVKKVKAYQDEHKAPLLIAGTISGSLLSVRDIEDLAQIPCREELLGMFVRTVAAPMSQLVGVMSQKVASLLYVLKAVEEKKKNS